MNEIPSLKDIKMEKEKQVKQKKGKNIHESKIQQGRD